MNRFLASGLLAVSLAVAAPVAAQDTIRFAVTDIDGLEALQREMGPFKQAFEAASGLKVEFFPVSGRTVAVEALIAGDIGGIGLNRTHIDSISKKFPDQKFRVVVKGGQLPDDVLLASPKVSPETVETVRKTFAEQGEALMAAITATEENAKYIGGSFNASVTDADYDGVRKMYENIGIKEFTEFVGQ